MRIVAAAVFVVSVVRVVPAATINVPGGDVASLIAAITTSNANGEDDTNSLHLVQ